MWVMSTKNQVKYREGYKYQLVDDSYQTLSFCPPRLITTDYIMFTTQGVLTLAKGYAWDGPSGPTIDDETNMRGSAVHDALYQLMRLGLLGQKFRNKADVEFKNICIEDGMNHLRAEIYFEGVHLFGATYAKQQVDEVFTAPKLVTDEGVI